ncbi:MAG: DEAD/DEAH box helicase [Candidatus Moranbacteria bacterium]|nr:DEAD/DEAH box helicase [Candidatus Moranbacteria bacterium]
MKNHKSGRRNSSGNRSFSKNSGRPNFRKSNSRSRFKRFGASPIDIQQFIQKATNTVKLKPVIIQNSFKDFGFNAEIEKNLEKIGYETPTPIQDQSINHIMEGKDLLGLANTGTGKTAAFLLPLIHKCFNDNSQKVLIIAPTRELAQQIDQEFKKFSKNMRLYSAICVGGMPIFRQISDLRRNPNFIIGTPGRLKDLKQRKNLNFSMFQNIVLDEIDRMLDMGFVDEIRQILSELPKERQTLFFSATMPSKIEVLVQQFLNKPITIKTVTGQTAANVHQDVIKVSADQKFEHLKKLLSTEEQKKVIIFSETKRDVDKLAKGLFAEGFKVDSIHGDKRQNQRQKALSRFKDDHIQILVATDVAARGIDVSNISHVINYTVPQTYDDYVHRIGRTGRGGHKGTALTFVN